MLGWSIRARAWRSASKRAMIWRLSMPGLMSLRATLRWTLRRRQFSQLVVDQWQQLLCGLGVALFDRRQNSGDFAHQADGKRGLAGRSMVQRSQPSVALLPPGCRFPPA